jgi:RNA polymerase sigma-B factor
VSKSATLSRPRTRTKRATEREPDRHIERNDLIERYLGLAYSIAERYRRPAASREDLRQVAAEALIRAADRFDPGKGNFAAYAVAYVEGSLKRYYRDQTWAVRPPRSLQERTLAMFTASEEFAQRTGRSPRPAELAEAMGCTRAEVIEAIECGSSYQASSLDAVADPDRRGDWTVENTDAFGTVEDLVSLGPLIAGLPERDRLLLALRFGAEMTQTQIAEQLGISQMQVSRLLTACLARLRRGLLDDAPAAS